MEFKRLGEQYFKTTSWPEPWEIEDATDKEVSLNTQVFYMELNFRHIYTHQRDAPITPQSRVNSWENYKELFTVILQSDKAEQQSINLPAQYVWDILDEFLYQFTINCQWRSSLKDANDPAFQEIATNLKNFWNFDEIS